MYFLPAGVGPMWFRKLPALSTEYFYTSESAIIAEYESLNWALVQTEFLHNGFTISVIHLWFRGLRVDEDAKWRSR